jgi:maltose O-acetyltransferase
LTTQRELMLAGELYDAFDAELVELRERARGLLRRFNANPDPALLTDLFERVGEGVWIEPPFHCDYGTNIVVGDTFYANAGCVFLDCARIEIGDRVLLGPHVQLLAATHPLDVESRRNGLEYARRISVGDDAWLGGGAILLPGVTVGAGSVIGAGSVVTRDVPPGVVAVGNPCRVVRDV